MDATPHVSPPFLLPIGFNCVKSMTYSMPVYKRTGMREADVGLDALMIKPSLSNSPRRLYQRASQAIRNLQNHSFKTCCVVSLIVTK